jgi:HD-like signal output (HDOD) protein
VLIQILSRLPAGLAAPGEMARRILDSEHARVGRAVAMRQQWPSALCGAIARHHDYDPSSDDDESALLVGLARKIWKAASSRQSDEEHWPETSALGLSDYHVTRVIDQMVSLKPRLLALGGYLEEETAAALAS